MDRCNTTQAVPKPKWLNRAPPERAFQGLSEGCAGAYDTYMLGVVFCSMAFGIDFPHLDRPSIKQAAEQRLKMKMVDSYLSTFELGAFSVLEPHAMASVSPTSQGVRRRAMANTVERHWEHHCSAL